MVAYTRHSAHQQKRHGKHQKQTKQFKQVYWPYIPLLFFVIVGLVFNWQWQPHSSGATLPYATSVSISDLLSATNRDRASNGVAALAINSQLNQAAQAKANDMVARNYWSHNTPDGQEPWVFINNAGYKYQKAGENLAYGFLTSADTEAGWMNSPPHKANLLDGSFQEVGFGFANSSNFNNDGEETVVVAMYGKPTVLAAATTSSTPQTSPSSSKKAPAPTVAQAPPPAAPVEQTPPAETQQTSEQPVTTEQVAAVEPTARSISRIQAFTRGSMPWIASTLTMAAMAGIVIVALKHGLVLKRMLTRGERFVFHHLAFDVTVIAFIGFVFILTRTAGIIR